MTSQHQLEDVWNYPRPPRLERVAWPIRVEHRGEVIVDASEAHRVLETSQPPVYFVSRRDIMRGCLRLSRRPRRGCEWKGLFEYYDLAIGDNVVEAAAWSYPEPTPRFAAIADAVAFDASKVDACFVDGERVQTQSGSGWITSWIGGGERGFAGGAGS